MDDLRGQGAESAALDVVDHYPVVGPHPDIAVGSFSKGADMVRFNPEMHLVEYGKTLTVIPAEAFLGTDPDIVAAVFEDHPYAVMGQFASCVGEMQEVIAALLGMHHPCKGKMHQEDEEYLGRTFHFSECYSALNVTSSAAPVGDTTLKAVAESPIVAGNFHMTPVFSPVESILTTSRPSR